MAQKSKKIKNKPRPPPAPGSHREDPLQPDAAVEDPVDQEGSAHEDSPAANGQQVVPSEKEDDPSGHENPVPSKQLPTPDQQDSAIGQPDPSAEKSDRAAEQQNLSGQDSSSEKPPANSPPPPSATKDFRPPGSRQDAPAVGDATDKVGELAGPVVGDMKMPGNPLSSEEDKSSLKIKIHLNLHAKVRLDLDAQIYGDIVIGLL
ncbi:hypothetical protein N7466_007514 [Penicillium verhagenii]|uniref:uncharacterized protein n=1 Tax=Penicillium verhagenii TaxID=1562060 RepID=UPI002545AE1F|nr:uncharacterized protein N7466_007514 [Penicillium verhagenii]KAJ5928558.1 hypothetical protein N7466_007514 [Penicillium verhagenii]